MPQLYLGFSAAAQEPPKQLKGFKRILVKAGTSVSVTFHLTDRDLSIWNVVKDSSNCSSGAFEQDVDYFNQDQQTRVGWVGSVDECCALCVEYPRKVTSYFIVHIFVVLYVYTYICDLWLEMSKD